ncbi:MAG TPA: hypothetical protein VN911_09095 [Candidatus Acidoferrum sp.]|nr:hypothetical protein [Candidatus Acidoferrum sp.]
MATHDSSSADAVPAAARPQGREFLDDILRSIPFRTSRQCQDLLRYIVEHSLAGSDDSLRERMIGIEVFGRAPDYDTAEDPVVRVRAADVRKRLAQYYQTQKNLTGQWKIEIPTGSYRAQFHRPEGAVSQVATAADVTHPSSEAIASQHPERLIGNTRFRKRNLFWATGAAILLAALFSSLRLPQPTTTPTVNALDLFWGPVLENPRPVFVCTGSNSVYVLSAKAIKKYKTAHSHGHDATTNSETVVPLEELKNLSGDDFIPVKDRFLTTGDASATAQISSLLTSRHHPYDLRFGTDLSFGDLRNSSAVLIGAFNNGWTLNMTDNLRFVYESGDSPQMHVQDRFDTSRSWWPKFLGEKDSEDYAIVSRILDSKTGSVLVIIAGLTHRGTQAAGDFTTNPGLVAEFIKQAPKDWSRKNLQIVLHTNVVNDIPGSPTVVASYSW